MRDLLVQWLYKALEMDTGEELYIPSDNKDNQKEMYKQFRRELDTMRKLDPENAAKIRVSTTYKDTKFWVVLKKVSVTPLTAYKKGANGIERVQIVNERDALRREKLLNGA